MPRTHLIAIVLSLAGLTAIAPARAADPEPRVVSVSGHGEVRAQPDRATVTLGIEAREPSLEAARSAANRVMVALLKRVQELRIPAADVRSTRISVNPEYNWNEPQRARELVAYNVQRQLIVELKDLERLGELLEKGLSAGANLVGEPLLDSSQRPALRRQALTRAVEDARATAAVLASALGASVGAARSVAESGESGLPLPVARLAMAKMAGGEAPETYVSGELTIAASVAISFDLVPGAVPR